MFEILISQPYDLLGDSCVDATYLWNDEIIYIETIFL